jgi:hypothetical protein
MDLFRSHVIQNGPESFSLSIVQQTSRYFSLSNVVTTQQVPGVRYYSRSGMFHMAHHEYPAILYKTLAVRLPIKPRIFSSKSFFIVFLDRLLELCTYLSHLLLPHISLRPRLPKFNSGADSSS